MINADRSHTNSPRELTDAEKQLLEDAMRVATWSRGTGIKLHRELTNSTLGAALRYIDAFMADRDIPT